MNEIERHLHDVVNRLNLKRCEKDVIFEIAKDPHGLPEEAAYSMIPLITGTPSEADNKILLLWLEQEGYIEKVVENSKEYLRANYTKLGVSDDVRVRLSAIGKMGFVPLGEPHSPRGMETLKETFLDETTTLYVALGITSHEVFQDMLEQRIHRGYKTVFLFPAMKLVTEDEKGHHASTLAAWREHIGKLPAKTRKLVELRIVGQCFDALYTTLNCKTHCRINIRNLDEMSTRTGTMIRVDSGYSLYELIKISYKQLLKHSLPDSQIHTESFLREWFTKRHLVAVGLLFIALIVSALGWWQFGLGVAASLIGSYLYGHFAK